jgi:hypothetical protein
MAIFRGFTTRTTRGSVHPGLIEVEDVPRVKKG